MQRAVVKVLGSGAETRAVIQRAPQHARSHNKTRTLVLLSAVKSEARFCAERSRPVTRRLLRGHKVAEILVTK